MVGGPGYEGQYIPAKQGQQSDTSEAPIFTPYVWGMRTYAEAIGDMQRVYLLDFVSAEIFAVTSMTLTFIPNLQ